MRFEYKLVRSARRSYSVCVSSENAVTVRCPNGASKRDIEAFLNEKASWIELVLLRNTERIAENEDILTYKKIYICGEKYPLVISDRDEIADGVVYVSRIENVKKLLIGAFSRKFYAEVNSLSEKTKLRPESISIKSFRGRWGSCDALNNLKFNFKLFMLPPEIRRYVVVHELCHTVRHNHSKDFWQLVAIFEPDWKNLRRALKRYDFLARMY